MRWPFTRATPESAAPPTQPGGRSGRLNQQGFLEFEELNAELRHPNGYRVYDRMWRSDPDVRRAWGMWMNPIVAGTWDVEPYGGEDATDQDRQIAQLVKWALLHHMRGGLAGHLAEAASTLRHGFAPFEQVWHTTEHDGQTVLVPRYLGLRLPRSVTRWFQDDFEDLDAIEQLTLNRGLITLPASDLVYYRVGTEGDNWEGVSPLRSIYKPWFFKDAIERLDAIAQERHAVGIPVVYPPLNGGTDPVQLEEMDEILAGMRGGETGFIRMPGPKQGPHIDPGSSWLIEMLGQGASTQGGRDAQPSLKYHSDKIAAGLIAEFMRLGQGGEGARATADVQQDPFYDAVEGFASTVIEPPLNRLAQRIAQVNGGNLDGFPTVTLSLVDSTSLGELADYVQKLRMSEALQADDPLEDYLRDRADLPPADPVARAARQQQQADLEKAAVEQARNPTPPPGTAAGDPAGTKTAARPTRPLRHWEQHMSLESIDDTITGARARFQQAGAVHARELAATATDAVARGKTPKVDLAPLADALEHVLDDLYEHGRQTVREELASQATSSQRTASSFARGDQGPAGRFAKRARAAAEAIFGVIMRRIRERDLAGDDAAATQIAGEQAAAGAMRAEATTHAAAALNEGRDSQATDLADMIRGARYTSILDPARCDHCAVADDDVLRPLTDPVRVARKPPNRDCYGGDRCRCMEFFQLEDETAPSA